MSLLEIDRPITEITPDPIFACKVGPGIQAAFDHLAQIKYSCTRAKLMRACSVDYFLSVMPKCFRSNQGEQSCQDFSG